MIAILGKIDEDIEVNGADGSQSLEHGPQKWAHFCDKIMRKIKKIT